MRVLRLNREVLTELGPDDLRLVAAGAPTILTTCVVDLLSDRLHCDSVLRPCVSHTCTV